MLYQMTEQVLSDRRAGIIAEMRKLDPVGIANYRE